MKWQEMTSPEVANLAERDPVVILPIAAIEQHGFFGARCDPGR